MLGKSRVIKLFVLVLTLSISLGMKGRIVAQQSVPIPDTVSVRAVDIWSDGTRIAGDLYTPIDASGERPAIVMSHGWGGTKAGLQRYAVAFAADGFIVLAIDYRGWGESDSRLVLHDKMPQPDADGNITVTVQALRNVIDPYEQTEDIVNAIDWIVGEANVDPERIGYWGSSYSGAHAVWVAANEPRVKASVGQVPAVDSLNLVKVSWEGQDIEAMAKARATERARGDAAPVPQGTDKAPNLNGWTVLENAVRYRPVEQAGEITIPILIIDAENEELFDRRYAGQLAVERALANGANAKYHVEEGITHYGIYSGEPARVAIEMALEWYNEHLK